MKNGAAGLRLNPSAIINWASVGELGFLRIEGGRISTWQYRIFMTFGCGIASYPQDITQAHLSSATGQALYIAKIRNEIVWRRFNSL